MLGNVLSIFICLCFLWEKLATLKRTEWSEASLNWNCLIIYFDVLQASNTKLCFSFPWPSQKTNIFWIYWNLADNMLHCVLPWSHLVRNQILLKNKQIICRHLAFTFPEHPLRVFFLPSSTKVLNASIPPGSSSPVNATQDGRGASNLVRWNVMSCPSPWRWSCCCWPPTWW